MKKLGFLTATTILAGFPVAFNSGGWKVDDKGVLAKDDKGNPIWVDADGERSMEGGTVHRLNTENKTLRQRAEAAEAAVKVFEGIDPEKAKQAIETVGKLDQKKLIDAGEVDRVKEEISKQFNAQIAEKDKALEGANSTINSMRMDNAFQGSEYVRDNVAVPVTMFRKEFGDRFKIEDGKVVGIGADGHRIPSKKKVGEYADFEESLSIIVESYPYKDTILKAPEMRGSGSGGGAGNRQNGVRVIPRSEFEKMPPAQQGELAAKMGKGEVRIE